MTDRPRIAPAKVAQRSQEVLDRLAQFAQEHGLYDIHSLAAEAQNPVGEFYDFRLGMEPVFRLIRQFRDFEGTYCFPEAPAPVQTRGLFKLNLALVDHFCPLPDVEPLAELLDQGRLQITLYFGLPEEPTNS